MSTYDKASLVLIPSGTKESLVLSQKPTNGDGDFTFSRSTSATRVGASGYIEKETQNLLLQSNTFDTTWASTDGVTGGQSGYDGTNDAWLFTYATDPSIVSQANTSGGVQTYSVYAKGNTNNGLRLYAFGSVNCFGFFDLNAGSVEVTQNLIDATIEDKGNGWYRCAITFNQTNTQLYMYLSNNSNSNASSGSIYIQDAQLEQGLVARDYIETTTSAVYGGITDNIPRLDYTDSSCPALLLEPQRRNLILHSEYISGLNPFLGPNGGSLTITDNYTLSPEGVVNAARVQASITNTGDSGNYALINTGTVMALGLTREISFYAKSLTGSDQELLVYWSYAKQIVTLTSEWQRFEIPATSGASGTIYIGTRGGGGSNYFAGGDSNLDFALYGLQVEDDGAGGGSSYATSYIPTYGTSVTRVGDACYGAGNASTFNDSEGVFYAEVSALANDSTFRLMSISDGTSSNRITLGFNNYSNTILVQIHDGGVTQVNFTTPIDDITLFNKLALKYELNDVQLWVNGVKLNTDTLATMPSGLSELNLNYTDALPLYGNAKQVLYFPTALTDEELEALTTL